MQEPLAFFGGRWIAASAAAVSVSDVGFILGATVAEQLRTFAGKLFHLDEHLDRLAQSLEIVGLKPRMTREEFAATARELVARNHPLLAAGDDLSLSIFVTPGDYPGSGRAPSRVSALRSPKGQGTRIPEFEPQAGGGRPANRPHPDPLPAGEGTHGLPEPTVCLHTYPVPFHRWAERSRTGQTLATTEVEQVSPRCWPPSLKCRSRMHYYLADRRAAARDPGARALLLDGQGFVTEASTANVLIYRAGEGLAWPPTSKVLPGISLAVVAHLAGRLGIPCAERDLKPEDLASADEALLSSAPFCLLPVTRLDGRPIGAGRPGEIFARLMAAWNEMAGLDIIAQAERHQFRE
jgi:branched-subunit amino acid aminotransferase/4-amino-4-deoxychorismate lyase